MIEVTAVRPRRWPKRLAIALPIVILVAYAAMGWIASSRLIDGITVDERETEYVVDVVAVAHAEITIVVPADGDFPADHDAVMGLEWEGGYARVGPSATEGTTETRAFTLLSGTPPPIGEDVAAFDGYAFRGDPSDIGLAFETVSYPGPLGELDAWYLPGVGDRWLVMVHGLGASEQEYLRTLDALRDLRIPTLVITYRNDPGQPESGNGLILAGQKEWRDVAAAVDHAVANGAADVVLFGDSMGAALVLGYLVEQADHPAVGAVLESPVADLRRIVGIRSGEAIPIGGPIGDSFVAVARMFTWMRTGIDFDDVAYVDRADELTVPILLFHGTEDDSTPFAVGEALAEARPDLVEFHPLEGASHVKAWNEGPEEYRATVTAFLLGLP